MYKMKKRMLFSLALATCSFMALHSQSALYPEMFDLEDVELTDGPFLHAMQLNDSVLLQYDEKRLVQPFEKEAGLPESGEPFVNWCGGVGSGLDGHIGGHYLSALAMSYASCQDKTVKAQLGEKLAWCLKRLKEVQDTWDKDDDAVMHGYIGGVPESREVWTTFAQGDFTMYWKSWVPFYNIHKTYAGLRDAWLYYGNEEAREMFLKLCDWGIGLIENLTDDQLQGCLGNEHGGMNEMYADAYYITGEEKYLDAAERYSHKWLLDGMAAHKSETIDNVHANTQVPKVVGFERISQVKRNPVYLNATRYFWTDVATRRTIAVGGNSINEWFPAKDQYGNFISSIEGVETCNSYNMLKLSEMLFNDTHDSKYMDFYEGTMYNHILSAQHPETGGYVYFTPARPQHYRVYSQVNEAMWCCVGSGMEDHGKYGQIIYTHSPQNDSLYLNLFVPSVLNWDARGIKLTQTTRYPYEQQSEITVEGSGHFTLFVRHPSWAEGFKVLVNGEEVSAKEKNGYLPVDRTWSDGDKVTVVVPMKIRVEPLQNYEDYVAFKYGPVLLGAKTGADNLQGLFADDSRMGHIAGGLQKDLYSAPLFIGNREELAAAVKTVNADSLQFRIEGYYSDPQWSGLVLQPFHSIHDSRYMMYWLNVDGEKWEEIEDELKAREDSVMQLEARTVDYVVTGTQQSENDHFMQQSASGTGTAYGEYYRDASGWFSYRMSTHGNTENMSLIVRYWGGDSGRKFNISINGKKLADVELTGGVNEFINVEYEIPDKWVKGKEFLNVKFTAESGSIAGGVFYVRLCKSAEATGVEEVFKDSGYKTSPYIRYDRGAYDLSGRAVDMDTATPGVYILKGKKVLKR